MVETRSVSFSVVAHALALLIAAFGLPALLPKKADPVPLVMTVELLPISELSNVKPSDKPITPAQNKPTPTPQKPVPTPPAPKTPTPPVEKATPTPPPPTEKSFDPDMGAEAKDKIKPIEKKEPKPVEKKNEKSFEDTLKELKEQAEKEKQAAAAAAVKDAKDKANVPENKTKSDAPYDASMPLSISEKDMIRSQFIPCWTMPAGAKDASTLAVLVKVELQADGTVLKAEVAPSQMGRYNSDLFYRAAADSAVRAVHKCSPLKNLPADKYGSWKEMEINFNPQDL